MLQVAGWRTSGFRQCSSHVADGGSCYTGATGPQSGLGGRTLAGRAKTALQGLKSWTKGLHLTDKGCILTA